MDRPETWDTDLLHDFQKMVALRKERPALRRGSFAFLYAEGDVSAFIRQLGDESVVVAFNTGRRRPGSTSRDRHLNEGVILDEVWSREVVEVEDGSFRQVELAPRSGRVFATRWGVERPNSTPPPPGDFPKG